MAGDGPYGFSKLMEHWLAGLIATTQELSLFFAPNINSYKRYVEGSFAPTAIAWGLDNRTCALRVVGHGSGLRVENRVPGGDVNQYLAVAALIAGGLYGIENELELEPIFEGNAYGSDAPRVPTSLRDAAELFGASDGRARGVRAGRREPLPQQRAGSSSARSTPPSQTGSGFVASSASEQRPIIGLTTYLQQSQTGVWDVPASFLPQVYLDAVTKVGRHRGAASAAARRRRDRRRASLDSLDGLIVTGGRDVDPARYGQAAASRRPTRRASNATPGKTRCCAARSTASCRFSGSAAERRCSTSRSAAPSTSTCPTSSASTRYSPGGDQFNEVAVDRRGQAASCAELVGAGVAVQVLPPPGHRPAGRRAHRDGASRRRRDPGRRARVGSVRGRACSGTPSRTQDDLRLFEGLVEAARMPTVR